MHSTSGVRGKDGSIHDALFLSATTPFQIVVLYHVYSDSSSMTLILILVGLLNAVIGGIWACVAILLGDGSMYFPMWMNSYRFSCC